MRRSPTISWCATGAPVGWLIAPDRRAAYGVPVLTAADYGALTDSVERRRAARGFNRRRQDVETAFSTLADRLAIKFPRARSTWGAWTRLAAKVAAFNLAVYVNHLFQRPTFTLFNPLDSSASRA